MPSRTSMPPPKARASTAPQSLAASGNAPNACTVKRPSLCARISLTIPRVARLVLTQAPTSAEGSTDAALGRSACVGGRSLALVYGSVSMSNAAPLAVKKLAGEIVGATTTIFKCVEAIQHEDAAFEVHG